MSEPLPELLDVKALRAELGVSRAAAETIMRQVPVVAVPRPAQDLLPASRRRSPDRGADVRQG